MQARNVFSAVLVALLSAVATTSATSRRDLLQGSNGAQGSSTGPDHALIVAVTDSKPKVVKNLLMKGKADVDAKNAVGSTPLMIAAGAGGEKDITILKALLAYGANVNERNKDGFAALHFAASKEVAEELLGAEGVDIDIETNRDATPLYIATQNGRTEVMKVLLAKGANPNAEFVTGAPPLLVAAESGNLEALKVLLSNAKVNVTKGNANQVTALHLAVSIKNGEEAVILLLKAGLDVDVQDKWGDTPLDYAAHFGNEAMVDLLLDNRADKALPDSRGNLPQRSVCRCEDAEGSPGQLQCPEGNCSEEMKTALRLKLDPTQEDKMPAVDPMPEQGEEEDSPSPLPLPGVGGAESKRKKKNKRSDVSNTGAKSPCKSSRKLRKPKKLKPRKVSKVVFSNGAHTYPCAGTE